jgi:hypothetical protein
MRMQCAGYSCKNSPLLPAEFCPTQLRNETLHPSGSRRLLGSSSRICPRGSMENFAEKLHHCSCPLQLVGGLFHMARPSSDHSKLQPFCSK